MECYWTLFNNNRGGQNGNHAWEEESMDNNSSTPWSNFPSFTFPPPDSFIMHPDHEKTKLPHPHFFNPDPHFTSLELGKRHYFEDATPPPAAKRGTKGYTESGPSAVVVPRCQVEGCAAVLVNVKDYHRRHKVCEMHAKAPKVVVLGTEQRFCQQCSRFHAVGEFDEAKRSCRRRLAGHNERRRKSSQEQNALARKHSQGRGREVNNNRECALSLLSSSYNTSWSVATTSPDLPARCSAALRELIAENRASMNPQGSGGGHVTLNLMQAPNSAFGQLLSMHDLNSNSKDAAPEQQQDCSHLWKLPLGY